ncbi:hypothetical protein G647_07426 [Cladophialophora carrionii CBS 160.54]|uniref:Uncharacterized protein n=1 Tax=Cladophialophora carrionii CBS 160.54 TaxID=1279043 RepID=V9D4Z9_9EURO|nr:uncharacterized protein G647_07426 [Cladophialophora carrionii CBS 160.54]ETI21082.1 hypothetical protein G647_07426 [Cladophialophora carrionii CBS 160.54]
MSISRAFTKRVRRNVEQQPPMMRSTTVKYAPGTINRSLISLPTELISTTNVQALTAPDIRSTSGSSSESISSANDSDFSTIDRSFLTNTGSDSSSVDSSGPGTPVTPATDSKSFFDLKQTSPILPSVISPSLGTPAVPQRSPTHSKKAHVELSRKLSIQRLSPPPTSIAKPAMRDGVEPSILSPHPFGKELAQVNEVAEEFGATARLLDEEEQEILSKGLHKFGVEDYLDEIAGLYGGIFDGKLGPMSKPWI